jgi:hypothetical protein
MLDHLVANEEIVHIHHQRRRFLGWHQPSSGPDEQLNP